MTGRKIQNAIVVLFLSFVAFSACGGGGGSSEPDNTGGNDTPSGNGTGSGNNGTVRFFGTLDTLDTGRVDEITRAISSTNVCALGVCGVSDFGGNWSFTVPAASYLGGSISFQFSGPEFRDEALVSGFAPEARDIQLEFLRNEELEVGGRIVAQDGLLVPEPTPNPEDRPLPSNPQKRACEILQRSNITITNVSTPIIHQPSNCPQNIRTLAAVGNIHAIPFEYEVVIDVSDIEIEPSSGTVSRGEINRHDGKFLCTRVDSFVATVTARVLRYFPAGFDAITAQEAITQCGRNAAVGNTEDSKQITLQVAGSATPTPSPSPTPTP